MSGIVIKQTGLDDYLEGGEAWVKCLMLGAPSAGKTRSASFWPKPIFADCEKGRMSIADRNVPYAEITSSDQMDKLIQHLRIECMKPKDQRKYLTLVIDTLDSYQRIVTQERLRDTRKLGLSGWEDWGFLDAKMSSLIQAALNLPMNLVVNVHVKFKEGEDDEAPILGLKLKGDLRDQAPGDFDLVGYMSVDFEQQGEEYVQVRKVQWHPEPSKPFLKDRTGQLPKFTPVTFTPDDYSRLLIPIMELSDDLKEGAEVETIETDEAPEPVPPMAGGPVEPKPEPAPRAVKKAAAKKAATPAETPTPAASPTAVPPARPTVEVVDVNVDAGASAAPAEAVSPVDEPVSVESSTDDSATGVAVEPSHDEAVGTVADALGGEVVSESEPVESASTTEAPAAKEAAAQTSAAPVCGTPGRLANGELNPNPVSGCGKALSDEKREVVHVGFVKHRTYLCEACIVAANSRSRATV